MAYNILIVDDSIFFYDFINQYNINSHLDYNITQIRSNENFLGNLASHPTDIILMNWMIKDSLEIKLKDGLSLIKDIKFISSMANTPIILCTDKELISDEIVGINQGADEVFRKCDPIELLFCKMNALLRKVNKAKNDQVNLMRKFVFIDNSLNIEYLGVTHKLTSKEFLIFKTLVMNPGKTFSQETLNQITSGKEVFVSRRCIDTFISLIRNKFGKNCILSVRKKGYKMNESILDENYLKNPLISSSQGIKR